MSSVLDSLEKIYGRCDVDGDCRLWNGGMAGGRKGKRRYPIAQVADGSKPHGQRQVQVRRRVWELAKGEPAKDPARYVLIVQCGDERCVSEHCLRQRSRAQLVRQTAKKGFFRTLLFRARVAEGKRRESRVSDQAVAEIRARAEPIAVLAARHGISLGYAYAIAAGVSRKDYSSPYAALEGSAGFARP